MVFGEMPAEHGGFLVSLDEWSRSLSRSMLSNDLAHQAAERRVRCDRNAPGDWRGIDNSRCVGVLVVIGHLADSTDHDLRW